MNTGIAEGGPLDGQELISRMTNLLVVDRVHTKAYVYDWTEDKFIIRAGYEDGQSLRDEGRFDAAESEEYDVIAWVADD